MSEKHVHDCDYFWSLDCLSSCFYTNIGRSSCENVNSAIKSPKTLCRRFCQQLSMCIFKWGYNWWDYEKTTFSYLCLKRMTYKKTLLETGTIFLSLVKLFEIFKMRFTSTELLWSYDVRHPSVCLSVWCLSTTSFTQHLLLNHLAIFDPTQLLKAITV